MSTYASLADLTLYGCPATSLGALSTDQQNAALSSASEVVDSYLRGRFSLPLTAWGVDITEATCRIAAYNLMNIRGYNPASAADVNLLDRYTAAISWLRDVQRQAAHPNVTPQQAATPDWVQPFVYSTSVVDVSTGATAARRGW
jgi:phage gp36-like protein